MDQLWYDDSDYEYGYDDFYGEAPPMDPPPEPRKSLAEMDDDELMESEAFLWPDCADSEEPEPVKAEPRELSREEMEQALALERIAAEINCDPEPLEEPEPDPLTEPQPEGETGERVLRRYLTDAARSRQDFEELVRLMDKRESSRARTVRNHEMFRGDLPLEVGVRDLFEARIFPRHLCHPTHRQLSQGNFLDFLALCPHEMHNLSSKSHICGPVRRLKPDHLELLYFMGLQLCTPQQMALIRGQTDRNIRKVRDTMRRKLRKAVCRALEDRIKQGYAPNAAERALLYRYRAQPPAATPEINSQEPRHFEETEGA